MTKAIVALALLICTQSCVSFNEQEQVVIDKMTSQGIDTHEIKQVKSPGKAAALALLPGGGLYVAGSKDRPSGQKEHTLGAVSIMNWATWPVSILWAVPQSYIDAERINQKEAIYQYAQADKALAQN